MVKTELSVSRHVRAMVRSSAALSTRSPDLGGTSQRSPKVLSVVASGWGTNQGKAEMRAAKLGSELIEKSIAGWPAT